MSDEALSIYCDLPMDVVPRMSELPSTFAAMTTFISNAALPDGDSAFTLHGDLPDRLEAIRERLDHWWSSLDTEAQQYLIQNRNNELDGTHKAAVMSAGDGRAEGLVVSVVQDTNTGAFRLPPVVDVYVEMVSR
ncbi:hypothetical protein [Mycolicibacterium gilvum]|uniref:Uncharacterized protein n=1 Tax=Mycolicibacterium gilvum (strain DSM 45189 / LMG 24558 / Spyr1) TaxID=278137 RepID=E6TMT1_MYCSR|nr:hypothetical protein [Mycolicibacterium gilvum]ADT97177.1 hypothetical protein Mspyr1_04660 [Mycolicibacterium gilvum Spyr1]